MLSETVLKFLKDLRGLPDDFELGLEASLLQNGLVDSLGIEELIVSLEGEFGIQLDDDDLVPEHFDSSAGIAALVERKHAAG